MPRPTHVLGARLSRRICRASRLDVIESACLGSVCTPPNIQPARVDRWDGVGGLGGGGGVGGEGTYRRSISYAIFTPNKVGPEGMCFDADKDKLILIKNYI